MVQWGNGIPHTAPPSLREQPNQSVPGKIDSSFHPCIRLHHPRNLVGSVGMFHGEQRRYWVNLGRFRAVADACCKSEGHSFIHSFVVDETYVNRSGCRVPRVALSPVLVGERTGAAPCVHVHPCPASSISVLCRQYSSCCTSFKSARNN